MPLVDTSIWVDHLRRGDVGLAEALHANQVATHDFAARLTPDACLKSMMNEDYDAGAALLRTGTIVPVWIVEEQVIPGTDEGEFALS